jgi:two-component system NtrC family response regulator
MGNILVVEDDESLRRVIQAQLQRLGHSIWSAPDGSVGLDLLRKAPQDLVICDLNLPDMTGIDVLKEVRGQYPETMVVIVTAYGTITTAVEAIRHGAYDYLTKPVHPDELAALIGRVFERKRLIDEVRVLRSTVDRKYGFEKIVGSSDALMHVLNTAASVAQTDATVLILGETGTGKELLAKAIHLNSSRSDGPFVVISCGSIPKDLLESELFGHLKGSFTGAYTHKKGKVEMADGGTLFLDEIGDMPLELQVRVLRLVQDHEIERIGAVSSQKVNVRIIAATHRDLQARVREGSFREDLYYRLAVVPIELPPLRDRGDDIPILVETFFERAKSKHHKPRLTLAPELMAILVRHRWPGNIRELENLIERLVVLSSSNHLAARDLPATLHVAGERSQVQEFPVRRDISSPKDAAPADPDPGTSLQGVERQLISDALRRFKWNRAKAARYLGISRKTLLYRIAKHGIEKEGPIDSIERSFFQGR